MEEDGGLNLMYWINTFLDAYACMHVRFGADTEVDVRIRRLDNCNAPL